MRGNAGGHAYGDTFGTINQQVRNLYRQYGRLFFRLIEVRNKVYHILVQICQKSLLRHLLKSCLGITHGCGTISFNVAEVTMAVDQGHALFEILAHDYQCLIDGTVAVGVIFTHGITYDTGTFTVGTVVTDPQFVHIVESSALYRLQAVSDIRQGSGNDNAHGIVDERFLHLLGVFCFYDSAVVHFWSSPF